MSLDFGASYASGALGILIGSPLDLMKVQRQAGLAPRWSGLALARASPLRSALTLARGAAAPVLGYGALNGLLFVSYHRGLAWLAPAPGVAPDGLPLPSTPLAAVWAAGAAGGLASFAVSCPTEVLKCRAQLASAGSAAAPAVARAVVRAAGLRGLYAAGCVTAVRDCVGYGFYFWTYEACRRATGVAAGGGGSGLAVMLCGGVAGVATWASIFPLDAVKTRLQGMPLGVPRPSAWAVARGMYVAGGVKVFFAGLGACSVRAFGVNAVTWWAYEALMEAGRAAGMG